MTTKSKPKKPRASAAKPLSGLELIDCEQKSEEWAKARCGIITASRFGHVLADSEERKQRTAYLYDLAGEKITGIPAETYTNAAMERGNRMEAEARQWYVRNRFCQLTRVGFAKNSGLMKYAVIGASPDSLIDRDGGLEIKSMIPRGIIEQIVRGAGIPSAFRAQVQGNIWVFERKWWDLMLYYTGFPPVIMRIARDDAYIARLEAEIERFNYDLTQLVKRLEALPR